MGAKCCMPVRDDVPMILRKKYRLPHERYARRNARCSPSWSFRCDNRTHIEDIVDSPAWLSCDHGDAVGSEIKSAGDTENEGLSDGSSSFDALHRPNCRKFPNESIIPGNSVTGAAGLSMAMNTSHEEKEISESSCTVRQSSSGQGGPLYPGGCPQFPYPTSSSSTSPSRDHGSSKEISEERAPTFESISEEGSPSFKLSFSSNDLSAGESHAGSSDGWSKRSFSEFMFLLDSYQRDDINSQLSSSSFSSDLQTCGLCSKLLRERASWKGNEICTAAILVCGHVYHAECLETVTSEASKFDPSCPACTHGESSTGRVLVKASSKSRSKISKRSAVADIIIDGTEDQKSRSCILKELKSGASSSGKSSFGLSFFRRPFSIMGSRSIKLSPKRECSRKKGFWARYR